MLCSSVVPTPNQLATILFGISYLSIYLCIYPTLGIFSLSINLSLYVLPPFNIYYYFDLSTSLFTIYLSTYLYLTNYLSISMFLSHSHSVPLNFPLNNVFFKAV